MVASDAWGQRAAPSRTAATSPVNLSGPAANGTSNVSPRRTVKWSCSPVSVPAPESTTTTENAASSSATGPRRRSAAKNSSAAGRRQQPAGPGPAGPVQRGDPLRAPAAPVHALQGQVVAQPEMPVAEAEVRVLEQHREVGRLLNLDQQDAGPDRVRHPGRAEHRVTGPDRDPVGRREHLVAALAGHPGGQLGGLDVAWRTQMHVRVRLGRDDHPGFGLTVRRGQMIRREPAVRVHVQRQALPGVEQLDQHRRIVAVRRDVRAAEPPERLGAIASASSRPSGRADCPAVPSANRLVVDATQSSGRSGRSVTARNAAIRPAPR